MIVSTIGNVATTLIFVWWLINEDTLSAHLKIIILFNYITFTHIQTVQQGNKWFFNDENMMIFLLHSQQDQASTYYSIIVYFYQW